MIALIVLIALYAGTSFAEEPTAPTAPDPVDYSVAAVPLRTVTVMSGDAADLAAKIASMQCGDLISLPVATYNLTSNITIPALAGTCAGGLFTGRSVIAGSSGAHAIVGSSGLVASAATTTGDNYVIIASANQASLPAAGTRVNTTTDVANMPTINIPNVFNGVGFKTADRTHHVILRGLHIVSPASCSTNFCTSVMVAPPGQSTDITTWPHHVYIERSYLEGAPGGGTYRGVHLMGRHLGVSDSVVINNFTNAAGADHQAVAIQAGNHFLVDNNTLSADSETVMLGDNNPFGQLASLIVSDVTIRKNFMYHPLNWITYSAVYPLTSTQAAATSAAIDSSGTCVTLTGKTPDASWSDGTKYFLTTADKDGSGYYNKTFLITAINTCGTAINTLTLASAHTTRASQSGLAYHISYFAGAKSGPSMKNHWEAKSAQRVLLYGNVMQNISNSGQFTAAVLSARGANGALTDIDIRANYFKNVVTAVNWSLRPTVVQSNAQVSFTGDGTTNCNGSPCIKITFLTGVSCDCVSGETVIIESNNNVDSGVNEAKGVWGLTKIDLTHITIPVAYLGGTYLNNLTVAVYHGGTPASRIRIKDNVIEEPGSWQAIASDSAGTKKAVFIGGWTTLIGTTSDGHDDHALSTIGNWQSPDINVEHNTCVSPALSNQITGLYTVSQNQPGGYVSADEPMPNFSFRSNLCMYSGEGGTNIANYSMTGSTTLGAGTSVNVQGVDALMARTDDGSSNISNNVFYKTGLFSATQEYAKMTTYKKNAVVADNTKVGFSSYTSGTPSTLSTFALTDLFTTGTCTTATNSLTVTCSNNIPATIVKGTPFKINSDGRFCLVNTVSTTSFTLQASVDSCTATGYPSTNNNAAFTLGFRGWGHDGADPGADLAEVMSAISGVVQVPSGVIVDP